MGLSIYYRYKIKTDADGARDLVSRLHAFARTLPFDSVTDIVEYDPPDGRYTFRQAPKTNRRCKPGAEYLLRRRDDGETEHVCVPGLHVMEFVADIAGAESAVFGLASHPPVVLHRQDIITKTSGHGESRRIGGGESIEFPTRLRGWYSWSNCCKTQYAAHPSHGGEENFVRAHLSLFRMVDECERLGITARIRDDAKYWRHRDRDKLIAELHRWDAIVASFVGRFSDAISRADQECKGSIVAPIKSRPDFEHLEAKGVDLLSGSKYRKPRRSRKATKPRQSDER